MHVRLSVCVLVRACTDNTIPVAGSAAIVAALQNNLTLRFLCLNCKGFALNTLHCNIIGVMVLFSATAMVQSCHPQLQCGWTIFPLLVKREHFVRLIFLLCCRVFVLK